MKDVEDVRIAVSGLGYVGLPLAAEFGRVLPTLGFDIDAQGVEELNRGHDRTREGEPEELAAAAQLEMTAGPGALAACNVFIVTVPTPIDAHGRPDLGPLLAASRTVGLTLKDGDVVIYESTVYPGATEEDCAPMLAAESGLVANEGFFLGYSPERVNPEDKAHRIPDIVKVTSGSTPDVARFVDDLSARIIRAGSHWAPSIRVAEAEVIENTQRDVNIALVNELALLFDRLGLDTEAVLAAAGTKWNFLPARAGGRALHRGGSVLPDAQGPGRGPPSGDDPGRAARERRHGRAYCRSAGEGDDPHGFPGGGVAHPGDGAGVQGELPGPAQHPGGGHHRRPAGQQRAGGRVGPVRGNG